MDSNKDLDKSMNSSESSDPPAEKNPDSALNVGDVETPADDDDRGSPPPGNYVDDSSTDIMEPTKDARLSFERSESSGSFENSISVGSSARREADENSTRSARAGSNYAIILILLLAGQVQILLFLAFCALFTYYYLS